jgi:hypothetical protein
MIFCINMTFMCIGEDFGKVVWKDQDIYSLYIPMYVRTGRSSENLSQILRPIGRGGHNATRIISHCERSDSGLT